MGEPRKLFPGMFEASEDVGTVLHPGSVDYDASTATYALTGSGENIWFKADAFQFVWKKMSGRRHADRRHLVPH